MPGVILALYFWHCLNFCASISFKGVDKASTKGIMLILRRDLLPVKLTIINLTNRKVSYVILLSFFVDGTTYRRI